MTLLQQVQQVQHRVIAGSAQSHCRSSTKSLQVQHKVFAGPAQSLCRSSTGLLQVQHKVIASPAQGHCRFSTGWVHPLSLTRNAARVKQCCCRVRLCSRTHPAGCKLAMCSAIGAFSAIDLKYQHLSFYRHKVEHIKSKASAPPPRHASMRAQNDKAAVSIRRRQRQTGRHA
ncbi:hypothetical protein PMIN04_001988 [Paraphaeosphaeria minitans]